MGDEGETRVSEGPTSEPRVAGVKLTVEPQGTAPIEIAQAPPSFPSWALWPGTDISWGKVHFWVSHTKTRCGKSSNKLDVAQLQPGRFGKVCPQCVRALEADKTREELDTHTLLARPVRRGVALNKSLGQLVRDVGEEPVDPKAPESVSRLQASIRGLFEQAKRGNANAAKLLFDRGWGPLPEVKVDLGKELLDTMEELGLSYADVASDPLTVELFRLAGVDVDRLGSETSRTTLSIPRESSGPSENSEAATPELHEEDVPRVQS